MIRVNVGILVTEKMKNEKTDGNKSNYLLKKLKIDESDAMRKQQALEQLINEKRTVVGYKQTMKNEKSNCIEDEVCI